MRGSTVLYWHKGIIPGRFVVPAGRSLPGIIPGYQGIMPVLVRVQENLCDRYNFQTVEVFLVDSQY